MKNVMPLIQLVLFSLLLTLPSSCSKDNELFADVINEDITDNVDDSTDDTTDGTDDSTDGTDTPSNDDDQGTTNPGFDDNALKAFPGAYGGGSNASGGRGGVLVMVNTLNASTPLSYDSGSNTYSGGLRAALSQNIGPRYIVFTVSGNISIAGSDLMISRDDITIFGQSAPRGGITIHGDNIQFSGVNNIIVRYIRSRNGSTKSYDSSGEISDDQSTYGFKVNGGNNIILDHVTASWGGDKAILLGTNQDVSQMGHTVQRSVISNSHTYMQMSMQNPANFHQRDQISCILNVFMRGKNRTPNIGGTGGYVEVKNNVIQTAGTKFGVIQWSDNAYINWTDNYYKIPTASRETNEFQRSDGKYNSKGSPYTELRLYTQGNVYENTNGFVLNGSESGKDSNSSIWTYRLGGIANDTPIDTDLLVAAPHDGIPNSYTGLSAYDAYESLINQGNVGACHYMDDEGHIKYYMDPLDADGINDIKNNTMKRTGNKNDWELPSIPSSKRASSYDTDMDGMADAWEIREFGDLSQGYNDDFDGDGYTNIEEFYNQ
ncbi:hypothetical protein [Flagellimonas pelagia]|nr:hypothetical protein [Allomuricauda maritima]TXJ98821.1 hypothetical protein FQ017_05615 [Allomuricauda maritima]